MWHTIGLAAPKMLDMTQTIARAYDLLIFDWDGTLMDSTATIAACIQAACVAVGEPEPPLELAKHVIGLGLQDALQLCAPGCPASKYPDLAQHYKRNFLEQDMHLRLFEGVREMLERFIAQGYTLAVATGKSRAGLDRVLLQSDLGELFATTRTADQTETKPSPRMVYEILEELAVPAHRALVIGDTTHDIAMANNAGVAGFAVTQGAHDSTKLATANPIAIAPTITDLILWLSQRATQKH